MRTPSKKAADAEGNTGGISHGEAERIPAKLAVQQAIRDEKTRRFTLQQCKDMMLITMHEDFGWGEERLKKLSDCYDQTFMTYAEMCLADAKTDKQIWFTQGKVDERLKKACGKYFVPWDERYR